MGVPVAITVRILLVEDEALVMDLLGDALSDGGYEVVRTESGPKALQAIEGDAARFRAVVTDIRLGNGPDGWAVAQRTREIVPNMPVVYMSGDSAHDWPSKGVPGSIMLVKPFAPAQLITAVSGLVTAADMISPPSGDAS